MQEKKHPEKIILLPELEKSVTEILVAHGRSFEPFVKTFSYSGENVAKFSLGTLVGVFEVDEKSEDSAYIVNFLASVAKKEYFNNPRRGAVESFEASLHKINLALAELVKHGNVGWLGRFHGALGIFEKNNFHFSATGEAKIILFRNDTISDIALGLASEESRIHPIKTFIEVSSGRLMAGDKVILSAPELFHLFSFEDLRKNALRMDVERFGQFLKTALINELDITGAIIIDMKEAESSPVLQTNQKQKKSTTDSQKTIANVFSQAAFVTDKKEGSIEQSLSSQKETLPTSEYIDSKTGHIYIQGDIPEEPSSHPLLDHFSSLIQGAGHSLQVSVMAQGKHLRKIKKQSLIALATISTEVSVASRKTLRTLRKQWRNRKKNNNVPTQNSPVLLKDKEILAPVIVPQLKKRVTDIPAIPQAPPVHTPESQPVTQHTNNTNVEGKLSHIPITSDDDIPPFIKAKLAAFYKKGEQTKPEELLPPLVTDNTTKDYRHLFSQKIAILYNMIRQTRKVEQWAKRWWELSKRMFRAITENGSAFYTHLSSLHKKIVLGSLTLAIILIGISLFLISKPSTPQTISTAVITDTSRNNQDAYSIQNEKNAYEANPTLIATIDATPIDSVFLDNTLYLISSNNITDIRADKSYALPNGSGKPKFVSAMDDLRLVFLYTEQGELFAWSPISKTFVKNTLNLPAGAKVQSMGTYLTYLYILDSATNQIYRFPRADGGFGAPTNWLRDTATFGESSRMAINETLFLTSEKNTIQAFFRGRFVKNLESLDAPLSVAALYTHPGLIHVYALDTEHKRIVMWNQEGNLIAQYFNEKIAEATTLTVDETNREIFFTAGNSLFSLKIGSL